MWHVGLLNHKIEKAIWWSSGKFEAILNDGSSISMSTDRSSCTIRTAGQEESRIVTALSTKKEDIIRMAVALAAANEFSPRPYLCKQLLPENTNILRFREAGSNSHLVVNWIGCTIETDSSNGITVTDMTNMSTLYLYPSRCVYTVTFPARVNSPESDRNTLKYTTPDVLYQSCSDILKSPAEFIMTTQTHLVTLNGLKLESDNPWVTPLRKAYYSDSSEIEADYKETVLPETQPLLGNSVVGYPKPILTQATLVSNNLFRLTDDSCVATPNSTPATAVRVYESRLASIFFEQNALILHDMSVLCARSNYAVHNLPTGVREVYAGDRLVRLRDPSPFNGVGQYHLKELMNYLSYPLSVFKLTNVKDVMEEVDHSEGGVRGLSNQIRRFNSPSVGEISRIGKRVSIRFADRCIVTHILGTQTMEILLPSGESLEVQEESAPPAAAAKYVEAATHVFHQMREESGV